MRNKFLTTITVAVCLAAGVAQPLRAQEPGRFPRPAPAPRSGARFALAPDPAQQPPGGQHPLQSLEDLRSELLSLADSVQEFAGLAPAELFDRRQSAASQSPDSADAGPNPLILCVR